MCLVKYTQFRIPSGLKFLFWTLSLKNKVYNILEHTAVKLLKYYQYRIKQ